MCFKHYIVMKAKHVEFTKLEDALPDVQRLVLFSAMFTKVYGDD